MMKHFSTSAFLFLFLCSSHLSGQITFIPVDASLDGQAGKTVCADFDGDGDIDVITHGKFDGSFLSDEALLYFENKGSNMEFEEAVLLVDEDFQYSDAPLAVDYDADGDVDILYIYYSELFLLMNSGDGTFSSEVINNDFPYGDIQLFDDNGDGNWDMVGEKSGFSSSQLVYLENAGANTFTETVIKDLTPNDWTNDLDLIDIDEDGDMDIIRSSIARENSTLELFRNDGNLSFVERELLDDSFLQANRSEFADLDSDGQLDIVVATDLGVYTLYGPFFGRLAISSEFSQTIEVADFDNNGTPDIMINDSELEINVFMNNEGSPTFSEWGPHRYFWSCSADFDLDGDIDFLCVNDELRIFENTFISSTQDLKSSEQIQIYPNPVTQTFTIENQLLHNQGYTIYEVTGKKAASGITSRTGVVDCSALTNGQYLLQIEKDGLRYSSQFVKK